MTRFHLIDSVSGSWYSHVDSQCYVIANDFDKFKYAMRKTTRMWKKHAWNIHRLSHTLHDHCTINSVMSGNEKRRHERRHAWLLQITRGFLLSMHDSGTCNTVLVTYWSQVCWKWARRWQRGTQRWRGVAVSVAQGAFPLANEGFLVPLHPLQLLISAHLAPLLRLCWVPRVQTLQGTFWSLLRGVGGKRADNFSERAT